MAPAAALHHSRDVGPVSYNAPRSQKTARGGRWVPGALHGEDPEAPTHSSAGALQPLRGRARRWAARVGHGPCAASEGGAAHRGAQRGVLFRADPRCSGAADGGPTGGGVPAPRFPHSRAGCRSAQDLIFISSFLQAPGAFRAAAGGTVGGSAYDRILFFMPNTLTLQFVMVVAAGEVLKV